MTGKNSYAIMLFLLLVSTLTLAFKIQPIWGENPTDTIGDWFNSVGDPIVGSNFTDIIASSIAQSGQIIQVNMTVRGNISERLPIEGVNEVDYVFAFDSDQNQSTGMPLSQLLRNDLGVDYFVGVYYSALGWMGRLFNTTEGTYTNITTFEYHESVISVNILLRDIGYPSSFYWMAFTRETNRTANSPDQEIMDKAPDQGHYSFEISGTIHNINTGLNYTIIQEALNNANVGDTIYVESGIYYENVVINKSVSLIGEDIETTVIDGNADGSVTKITANNVTLCGFTIQNSGSDRHDAGIYIYGSSNNNVSKNKVINNWCGIWLRGSSNNNFSGNYIINSLNFGIALEWSPNNTFKDNIMADNHFNFRVDGYEPSHFIQNVDASNTVDGKTVYYLMNQHNLIINSSSYPDMGYLALVNSYNISIEGMELKNNGEGLMLINTTNSQIKNNKITFNGEGLKLYWSNCNVISGNNIISNDFGVDLYYSSNNKFSHNNFQYNNFLYNAIFDSTNIWDDGYPSGGNYWSDYSGIDVKKGSDQSISGSDGIRDTAYQIDANNVDKYPLMGQFNTFEAGTWNGKAYNVDVVSNSTVSHFQFHINQKSISFDVTGDDGTAGFCRVTIPKTLLWVDDRWTIFVGDQPITDYTIIPDENYTYLYFTYSHSTKTVTIKGTNVIPEFPSNIVLLMLMLTTLVTTILLKKKKETAKPKLPDFL